MLLADMSAAAAQSVGKSKTTPKLKTSQDLYNDSIRDKDNGDFIHEPQTTYRGGLPRRENWFIKTAILCAPHKNFPGILIPCHDMSCSGHYEAKQAAKDRVIQGLADEVYLLQYNYTCSRGKHCKNTAQKSYVSTELLKTSRCPDFIRIATMNLFYLTHNGGVTSDLLNYLLNDTMSPKSFDDIQLGVKSFREEKYIKSRLEYEVARAHCQSHSKLPATAFPEFGAMDDSAGYNSNPNVPSTDYLIDIFKASVSDNAELMARALDDKAPSPVWSIDHTFNTNKRTKNRQVPIAPEYMAPGSAPGVTYAAADEDATLFVMGADGQVGYCLHNHNHTARCPSSLLIFIIIFFYRYALRRQIEYCADTKGTGGEEVRVALRHVKHRCARLGRPYARHVTTDDCCAHRIYIQKELPDALVYQDVKHLFNRVIEKMSKQSVLYGDACRKLHGTLTGPSMTVTSRNGKLYDVAGKRLPAPAQLANLCGWVENYKRLNTEQRALGGPDLFLPGFDAAVANQKVHIEKGCLADPIIDGLHYMETSDGKFLLLRGTNRDESMHRRLNNMWPDRCGSELARCLKMCFVYNWNAARMGRPSSISWNGTKYVNGKGGGSSSSSNSSSIRSGSSSISSGNSSSSSSNNSSSSSSSGSSSSSTSSGSSGSSAAATITLQDSGSSTSSGSSDTAVGTTTNSNLTSIALLISKRCPMRLPMLRYVGDLLSYNGGDTAYIGTTSSGNHLGTNRSVQMGIAEGFKSMNPGGTRASYSCQRPCQKYSNKRPRLDESTESAAGVATGSLSGEIPAPEFQMKWDTQSVSMLRQIVPTCTDVVTGVVSWKSVLRTWREMGAPDVRKKEVLKSKWQDLQKTIPPTAASVSASTVTASVSTATAFTSGASSNDVQMESAAAAGALPALPQSLAGRATLPIEAARFHPLSSSNFSLDEINGVTNLHVTPAPDGQAFTKREMEVWEYIMQHKNIRRGSTQIDWTAFESNWKSAVKVAYLQDRGAEQIELVYIRTAQQLKERHKTLASRKK